ncbi:MAG: RibD family protein [Chloroflexota bacterium]
MAKHRPHVTVKWAQSIDGRVATKSGTSQWITGHASRILAHRLRSEHDAVLVGIGTLLADNPRLTVRLSDGETPLRVVADTSFRTPPSANILSEGARGVLIIGSEQAPVEREQMLAARGATVRRVPASTAGLDLMSLMAALSEMGVVSVLVEGGPRLISEFLRRKLADRAAIFIAPKLVGAGLDAIGDLGMSELEDAIRLEEPAIEQSGDDLLIRAALRYRN